MLTNLDLERSLLELGFEIEPPLRAYTTKFCHPATQHPLFTKESRKNDGRRSVIGTNPLVLHPECERESGSMRRLPGIQVAAGYVHGTNYDGLPIQTSLRTSCSDLMGGANGVGLRLRFVAHRTIHRTSRCTMCCLSPRVGRTRWRMHLRYARTAIGSGISVYWIEGAVA